MNEDIISQCERIFAKTKVKRVLVCQNASRTFQGAKNIYNHCAGPGCFDHVHIEISRNKREEEYAKIRSMKMNKKRRKERADVNCAHKRRKKKSNKSFLY